MKKKVTFIIIIIITVALLYLVTKKLTDTQKNKYSSIPPFPLSSKTTKQLNNASTAKKKIIPPTGENKPLVNKKYHKIVKNYLQRLGAQAKITIQEIAPAKYIKFHNKQRLVSEVIISTATPKYGHQSFQAYIDIKTQQIIQQWNFHRKDGLFIKYNRPQPLHPSGEIKE